MQQKRECNYLGFIVVLFMLFSVGLVLSYFSVFINNTSVRTVTVQGEGIVFVEPDVAILNLSIDTRNEDISVAMAENTQTVNRVVGVIQAMGVAEMDIQTSNFWIQPEWDWSREGVRTQVGHTVNNSLTVIVRDIEFVGQVLTAALNAGATSAGGIRLEISDQRSVYEEALAIAMTEAKRKAEVLADLSDNRLGRTLYVIEQNPHQVWAVPHAREMLDAAMSMNVETGSLGVTASVTVTFRLR